MLHVMQNEIRIRDLLLDDKGQLNHRGYAKSPLLEYNPENVRLYPSARLNRLRLKEWDYYAVTGKDFFFSATVSHIGYAGIVFVYFIDFHQRTVVEETVLIPFGKGCDLPRSSESGDVHFRKSEIVIDFIKEKDRRLIHVDWKKFSRGAGLSADLTLLQPPGMDSIVMATPIGRDRFFYNHKINCMPVTGRIVFGKREIKLKKGNALGTLDWGRGVWEYSSFWNWASASGFLKNGRTVGLNLGKGFGDLSYATENCFFINGTMTKLDWVEFNYDSANYMRPWYFTSTDGKLNLTFKPFLDRTARSNLLLITSEVHQMFGKYSGLLITDDNKRIEIDNLIGWAEEHRARW